METRSRPEKLIPPRAVSLLVRRAGPLPRTAPAQVDTAVFRPARDCALVLSEDGILFSLYPVRSHSLRKILTFVLAAGFAPILPWWIPVGQPSDKTLAALARYPGLPCAVSWSAILFVAVVLCLRAETRDLLLGRGKVLAGVSLGALAMFLTLTLWSWSLT